jgi:hypothetical protein
VLFIDFTQEQQACVKIDTPLGENGSAIAARKLVFSGTILDIGVWLIGQVKLLKKLPFQPLPFTPYDASELEPGAGRKRIATYTRL